MGESPSKAGQPDEREYPHWGRVYLFVIIYTAAIIGGLWAFSRAFSSAA